MNIGNWSEEYQEILRKKAKYIESFGVEELAMRIAVALYIQDSCGDCESETIKMTLMTGQNGLWLCKTCTETMKEQLDVKEDK